MQRYKIMFITGAMWLIADLAGKALAERFLEVHKNTGIAFGIPLPLWLQIIVSIGLIGVLLSYAMFSVPPFQFPDQMLFGIILGGAIGNLWGRVTDGYVIDFIKLWPFPLFNLADIGITVGLIAITLLTLIKNKNG